MTKKSRFALCLTAASALVSAVIAGVGSLVALVILPSARHFLPKLALAPRIAVH